MSSSQPAQDHSQQQQQQQDHSTPPTLASRIRGSLYGVACADALGGPVEFRKRGTFEPVTGYRHNPNFDLAPGTWTDDTSMTLCLASSLLPTTPGGSLEFHPHRAIRNYTRWYHDGYLSATGHCFDIGIATRTALDHWSRYFLALDASPYGAGGDPRTLHLPGQADIDVLLNREKSCGNGSLMRVAPVGLAWWSDVERAREVARESSKATHPHARCLEACEVYTVLVARTPQGAGKAELVAELAGWGWVDPVLRARFQGYKTLGDWAARGADQIRSSGYVVDTLEAALWAFFTTESFREGALRVVNLGEDADTVGAVYGGLAGGWYGLENIPGGWVKDLAAGEMVEGVVEGLVEVVVGKGS